MKNIKKYEDGSFEFHQNVVKSKKNRKKDPTYRDRINDLNGIVKRQFEKHDTQFIDDKLGELLCENLTDAQKDDLRALYNYSSKPFVQLNDILTTGVSGTRQPLCPFCTINNVNTFDHLIPKNEFAELSDHPVNLMPCCSECNGKKSERWRDGNVRKYLNLYLDILPDILYLYVNLYLDSSTIKTDFMVENKNSIDSSLFSKIKNHYGDLKLCERFALNCDNVISELRNTLRSTLDAFKGSLCEIKLKESIIEAENKNRQYYGFNYWKSILKIECCKNDDIFNFLIK